MNYKKFLRDYKKYIKYYVAPLTFVSLARTNNLQEYLG